MNADLSLIAAAQMRAGARVHTVAQKLTVYELGCATLARCDLSEERRASIGALVTDAEKWLREFVARSHAAG